MSFAGISPLREILYLAWAFVGVSYIWHGSRKSTQYQSLFMRIAGRLAVPTTARHRILSVFIATLLTLVSLMLAAGLVR